METCFNYTDRDQAFFSSDEKRWITRIRKLEKQFPGKVTVLRQPEDNDGVIYAKLPASFLVIRGQRELTEEEKQAAKQRLQGM